MPQRFHVTGDLNVDLIWCSRNGQCDIHEQLVQSCTLVVGQTLETVLYFIYLFIFTSCGSPSASPSIFSIFLIMATFWWALRGYSILLGVGAPWKEWDRWAVRNKYVEENKPQMLKQLSQWLKCTYFVPEVYSDCHSTVQQWFNVMPPGDRRKKYK